MAQVTELWPLAIPGHLHAFSAKTAAAISVPGAESVLLPNRAHAALPPNRAHAVLDDNRAHAVVDEE